MLNLGTETEQVEHKKSTSELKEGARSIASMLNKHRHGVLYFGVAKNGDVVGQQVAESTLREISQIIAHSISPAIYPTIEELHTDDGKSYVRVSFEGFDPPYACKNVYYIRVADEDRPMEPDMLEAMMLERAYRKSPWDGRASSRPIADVDEEVLRKFVERGRARGRIAFEYKDVASTLSSLGLLVGGELSNAAEVLFCPSKDVQLKMGVFVDHRRTEVLDMHHEYGTLFDLVDKAELYIINNIRRRFVLTGERTRDEVPEIPRKVIREALLNAFAHRVWSKSGYVQIDIYHDAVDIVSPGWFIDGQDPEEHLDGESTSSDTRNKLIAGTLFRSGDIESSGLGMRMIRDFCDEAGVKVTYEKISFGTKLTFHRSDPYAENPAKQVRESAGKCGKVRERYGKGLSENELAVAEFIEARVSVSTPEIMEGIGLSERGTQGILKRLMEKGVVQRTGASKSTRYVIAG